MARRVMESNSVNSETVKLEVIEEVLVEHEIGKSSKEDNEGKGVDDRRSAKPLPFWACEPDTRFLGRAEPHLLLFVVM
jgi:hypothetical protein